MRISIFGLGYVGTVSSACLARDGHHVIGVDVSAEKVEMINRGRSPIIEPGIDELISKYVKQGLLRAVMDAPEAVLGSEMCIICVGTPGNENGSLNIRAVQNVCEEIGAALRQKSGFYVVVIRSTVLPGTISSLVIPALEGASGKRAGIDFGVCSNPEFMREGSALADYDHPPKMVIGATDDRSAGILKSLFAHLSAPLIVTAIEVAEMVKYVDNVWHAVKISFGNEIGTFCKAKRIDSHAVMDIFVKDTKLNISPAYLRPGFAFGGSCLPKDLRALSYEGRSLDLDLPLLNSITNSNQSHIERAVKLIQEQGSKRVGILGLSFKAGTDDLRESPMIQVVETLIGKGYDIRIFDRNVRLASLFGANRDYILNAIPHIHHLTTDSVDELLGHAQTIVIGNADDSFAEILDRVHQDQQVVDLVGMERGKPWADNYTGICWQS